MIVCLDIPDETNMISITMSTLSSSKDEYGTITSQTLFDPREVKTCKLTYEPGNGIPTSGSIYHNDILVSKQEFELK